MGNASPQGHRGPVTPNTYRPRETFAPSRTVRRAHERYLTSGAISPDVRGIVADSWRRSSRAGVDPDRVLAPVPMSDEEFVAYRASHPLVSVLPVFRALLGGIADQESYLMAVTDAEGRLLWVEGHSQLRSLAERMNFVEGAVWDERRVGTNAPGTSLAVDDPVQVLAAEHFSRIVQPWTCSAAPVHDPHTGEILGVIDVTGGDHLGAPSCLGLVRATALAAEGELLRTHATASARPVDPAGAGTARLRVLGRDEAMLTLGGRELRLSRRHSEIMTLLVQHPEGLTGDQLAVRLYDDASPITLRAELVRLRRLLGPGALDSRPYRLRIAVSADFTDVISMLERGSVGAALRHYAGPLLPSSEAPDIATTRRMLEQRTRAELLAEADPGLLNQWAHTPWGNEDLEVWELLARRTPPGALRSLALQQVRRLAAEYAPLIRPRALATSAQPVRV